LYNTTYYKKALSRKLIQQKDILLEHFSIHIYPCWSVYMDAIKNALFVIEEERKKAISIHESENGQSQWEIT